VASSVTAIDATRVEVKPAAGEAYSIASRCVVWAAGVAASPLGRQLADAVGAQVDRAGRVVVEPDLSLPGHPEISVIGDLAAALSYQKGHAPKPVPGVSPGAKQMGRAAAANILRRILIDRARAKGMDKRGNAAQHIKLDDAPGLASNPKSQGLVAVDDALRQLEQIDPRKA